MSSQSNISNENRELVCLLHDSVSPVTMGIPSGLVEGVKGYSVWVVDTVLSIAKCHT